jgi:hypothetical protein
LSAERKPSTPITGGGRWIDDAEKAFNANYRGREMDR